MRGEHIGEKMVVSEPLARVVQRHDKEIGPLQRLQGRRSVASTGHRVAERAAKPIEDGGLEQKVADRRGLAAQHFVDQVVEDVAVRPGEGPHEGARVGASL